MSVRLWTGVLVLLGLAWSHSPADAALTSTFTDRGPGEATLRIESDGADPIHLTCIDRGLLVNGLPPDSGLLDCSRPNRFEVVGGPGDNRIDLATVAPTDPGFSKGVNSSTSINAGAGDDVVIGPTSGHVAFVGGPGSDWLQGHLRAIDAYRFGPSAEPERDVVAEPVNGECEPSYFETDQPGLSWWTIPWDSIDFTSLASDDPAAVDERAPGGVLAAHRNRIVIAARSVNGVAIEAIAGGAGGDRLAGPCMVTGGEGQDTLSGTGQQGGLLLGGAGDDALVGGPGPDRLDGGPGTDTLAGGSGDDALQGGVGDDSLAGGTGGDVYLFQTRDESETESVTEAPGRGVDVLSFELEQRRPVRADLSSRSGILARARNLVVRGPPSTARLIEGIIGGRGSDLLLGNDGRNQFWSGGGTDSVAGRRGNDVYHVDWVASMPYGAYSWGEYWGGSFPRTSSGGRPPGVEGAPASLLRIDERANGGADLLDVGERWMSSTYSGSRLEGQITAGARVDLTARRWILRTRRVRVQTAAGGARHLERVRGTMGNDTIIGNAADNVLEGRYGRDRIVAGRGNDLCLTAGDRDRIAGCERVRRANPDR
jgi:Ca2+-binding RTX toxin-like protein